MAILQRRQRISRDAYNFIIKYDALYYFSVASHKLIYKYEPELCK